MGYHEYMTLYDPILRWVLVGSRWILDGTEVLFFKLPVYIPLASILKVSWYHAVCRI